MDIATTFTGTPKCVPTARAAGSGLTPHLWMQAVLGLSEAPLLAILWAALLVPVSSSAQMPGDQLTVTADINAQGTASLSIPGESYSDNVAIAAHGLLVKQWFAQPTNNWVDISSNYAVSVSGSGSDSGSGESWTYSDANPDYFSIDVDIFLDQGQLSLYAPPMPWVVISPDTITVQTDGLEVLGAAWDKFQEGLLTSPTNGQAFSVSGSSQQEYTLPPPIDEKGTFSITYRVTFQPGGTHLKITSVKTPTVVNGTQNTFVSTDSITLQALLAPNGAGVPVGWSVVGKNQASQALTLGEVHNADASGVSTFTFSPSQSAQFVQVRHSQYTSGIRRPANDPLSFEVIVSAVGLQSRLSETSLGTLQQDETDTLRQEYVDFQITVPPRTDIVPSLGGTWNLGPYHVQASVDLPGHYNDILAAYQGSSVQYNGVSYTVPANAQIIRTSVFRNPRYNKAVGSVHPNSKHCYGRALDLAPEPISLNVNGRRTGVDIDGFWYPALGAAEQSVGLSPLPEQGATPLDPAHHGQGVGDPAEDHLHVEW
jgi:hypothetical protein